MLQTAGIFVRRLDSETKRHELRKIIILTGYARNLKEAISVGIYD